MNSRKMRRWDMQHVWGRGEMHTEFWWGNVKGRDHLEDLDMVGNNIKWMLQKWDEGVWGVDWINVAQGNGRWWAFVNMVMNCQFP